MAQYPSSLGGRFTGIREWLPAVALLFLSSKFGNVGLDCFRTTLTNFTITNKGGAVSNELEKKVYRYPRVVTSSGAIVF